MRDKRVIRGTKSKEGTRAVADVTVTITIGETGTMVEMEAGEEGGGGGGVGFREVGTIDRHTGTGIVMTGDRCLLDDTCGMEGVDRGALHQGGPGTGIFHGETSEPGVLRVQTNADPRHLHNQPR